MYVRFPLVDRDVDLLVWTTTPWTLPSNVGAAVGPHVAYVRVRDPEGGRDLVHGARPRRRGVRRRRDDRRRRSPSPTSSARTTSRRSRSSPVDGDAFRVVADDFVTVEDGSGIVHLAPAFGEIDREVGEREGLPTVNPVNDAARFVADVGAPYAGKFVKDADPDLVDALTAAGKLVQVVDYTHSYPHCWRCDTPLIYWAKPTWFARTSAIKDALLARERDDRLAPGAHQARPLRRLARQQRRLGALPRPLLGHADPGVALRRLRPRHVRRIDRRALGALRPRPHRHGPAPARTSTTSRSAAPSATKGTATRIAPVLDAWFDSGSMPTAQFHYPFENTEAFESRFPADFICEAIDQTRGWFYSLLAVNTLVFDRTPYRSVVCLAHIVDEDGVKMSKSRGNIIDPWSVLQERGAEALRWYMFSSGSPWTPKRVYVDGIDEATRKFLLTLWNTYSFFVTYANLDEWTPRRGRAAPSTHVLDRWVRSRLHRTVRTVTDSLEAFDSLSGAQALAELVDDLSNWYVRRSRPRFWKSSDPAAHATLHECLLTITQLLAPFCPFITDELYRNLAGTTDSVHVTDWPGYDEAAIDDALEAEMDDRARSSCHSAAPRAATPSSACANRSRARSRCSAARRVAARRRRAARSPTSST